MRGQESTRTVVMIDPETLPVTGSELYDVWMEREKHADKWFHKLESALNGYHVFFEDLPSSNIRELEKQIQECEKKIKEIEMKIDNYNNVCTTVVMEGHRAEKGLAVASRNVFNVLLALYHLCQQALDEKADIQVQEVIKIERDLEDVAEYLKKEDLWDARKEVTRWEEETYREHKERLRQFEEMISKANTY